MTYNPKNWFDLGDFPEPPAWLRWHWEPPRYVWDNKTTPFRDLVYDPSDPFLTKALKEKQVTDLKEQVAKIEPGDYVEAEFEHRGDSFTVLGTPRKSPYCDEIQVGFWTLRNTDGSTPVFLKRIIEHKPATVEPVVGEKLTERTRLDGRDVVVWYLPHRGAYQYSWLRKLWVGVGSLSHSTTANLIGAEIVYVP